MPLQCLALGFSCRWPNTSSRRVTCVFVTARWSWIAAFKSAEAAPRIVFGNALTICFSAV